jgi:hypothetical protein
VSSGFFTGKAKYLQPVSRSKEIGIFKSKQGEVRKKKRKNPLTN